MSLGKRKAGRPTLQCHLCHKKQVPFQLLFQVRFVLLQPLRREEMSVSSDGSYGHWCCRSQREDFCSLSTQVWLVLELVVPLSL